jgi:L-alanine-DL-glutamate epimerase-like enolase superfamily enzyme
MMLTRKGFLKSMAGATVATGLFNSFTAPLAHAQETSGASPRQRRITGIEIFPFFMEGKEVIRIALGTMAAEEVLVRLRTNDGVVGWGEASPFSPVTGETQGTDVAMAKSLAGIVKGRDPFDLARIVSEMDGLTPYHPSIKAAFEMAIWDICGKIAGQPVVHLLGQYRNSFDTDRTVYLDKADVMAQKAKEIAGEGFKVVKVKLGESPEADIERMRTIRQAVGPDIRIRTDANQGWTPNEAVRALRGLDQFKIEFCEQPVLYSDWEGMSFVRQHVEIPIMADESVHSPADAIEAVRRDAVDMINIKLMKSGGILGAVRIAHIADGADMKCMLGCMSETRVALTAAAHVVMSQKNVLYADLDAFTEHKIDPVIGGMALKDGTLTLPDKPGLGLDIDPSWLKTLKPA